MPSLLDAADAFSQLGEKLVSINEAACARVRHRNATCHACLQVCAHEAISVDHNVLSLDHHRCTGCGACASVCPTQALRLVEDPNEYLRSLINEVASGTTIEVLCEYAPKKSDLTKKTTSAHHKHPDDGQLSASETTARIRCLAALDETTLIHAACKDVALHL